MKFKYENVGLYLTKEEKEKHLEDLKRIKNEEGIITRDETSEKTMNVSGLDDKIWPYILKINELNDIVTVESCQGHYVDENYVDKPGSLWLRVTKRFSDEFEKNTENILKNYPVIENEKFPERLEIEKNYWRYGDGNMVIILNFNHQGHFSKERLDYILNELIEIQKEINTINDNTNLPIDKI